MKTKILGLLALGIFASQPVDAAIVSGTYNFAIVNTGEVNPFSGSFDITFDNSSDITDSSTGLSDLSLPSRIAGVPFVFTYFRGLDTLCVGGKPDGAAFLSGTDDDWGMCMDGASTSPVLGSFGYFLAEGGGANDGEWSIRRFTFTPSSSVPEPGTLALLGLGLAGLGLSRRRKAA